ncbi:Rossmann-fold NAD(P)-binding domain-containing protein [Sphingobacterium paucimobilis]|nr:hypothetical protein [Sphingobacterium paucimobilis]
MRVVAYNIKEFEKELLAKANAKVHDLTLISNGLSFSTIHYAKGKEVIIISDEDQLDRPLLEALWQIGVRKIITRSMTLNHIDIHYASTLKMHIANTPSKDPSPESIAMQTIVNLHNWGNNKCLGNACHCSFDCENKKHLLNK